MLWTVQHQAQLQLRDENKSLREQLEQIEADNERLSNLVKQANNQIPNEQFMELLKLRGEAGLLRQQTNELQTLREQNQQLQTNQTTSNSSQGLQTTNPPPLAVYPKASWAFAGYATPEAAFQSLNWAGANGNLNALLDGLTPDMQKKWVEQFAYKSESDIADEIKNSVNKNTEVSVLREYVQSDGKIVLTILGDGEGLSGNNHADKIVFEKIAGQWKLSAE